MNTLEQAWYMRVHLGYTYEQIANEIFYSPQGARNLLINGFKRQSTAAIYKKVSEFCRTTCNGANCDSCKLNEFILSHLIRRHIK